MKMPSIKFALLMLVGAQLVAASFSPEEWQAVQKIGDAIRTMQPRLTEQKNLEYASGIYRASKRYSIDPHLLVAIAHRESSFREGLPEGAAGELGICQIRKMWVKNPQLIEEFGKMREKDLLRPARSFMVAAWILSDLKEREKVGGLPYWSYYNSVKFHNRFKYYIPVSRMISQIKRLHGPWAGTGFEDDVTVLPSQKYWTPKTAPARRMAAPSKKLPVSGWIAAALRKLDQQDQVKVAGKPGRRLSTATMQAAAELNVTELLGLKN